MIAGAASRVVCRVEVFLRNPYALRRPGVLHSLTSCSQHELVVKKLGLRWLVGLTSCLGWHLVPHLRRHLEVGVARVGAWHSGSVTDLSSAGGVQALSCVVDLSRVSCSSPLDDVGNGTVALLVSDISESPHVLLRVIPDGWR